MDYSNYTLFEILKYKIEFLDCLEYGMELNSSNKEDISKNITYIKNNLETGTYKDIISTLFTEYNIVNKSLFDFTNTYSFKKIIKMIKSKKASTKIEYIKKVIDCHENLNHIIRSFTEEQELINKINPKIKKLIDTHNNHFTHFLYFISYNMYICSLYPDKTKLKIRDTDIKNIVSFIKYCNQNDIFSSSIKILEENNELDINNEFERLSNKCIELENKQNIELKEVIDILNKDLENSKKS